MICFECSSVSLELKEAEIKIEVGDENYFLKTEIQFCKDCGKKKILDPDSFKEIILREIK